MRKNNSRRYCSNGHWVEDDQLNFCPECGLPLSQHQPKQQNWQNDDFEQESFYDNYRPNNPPPKKKKPVGYIVLSFIILLLVFVILEMADITNMIPLLHKDKKPVSESPSPDIHFAGKATVEETNTIAPTAEPTSTPTATPTATPTVTPTATPTVAPTVTPTARRTNNNEPYDMGIPDLHGRTISMDQMNLAVYWVQTQLKATGVYYQGENWDVTGNLGDHTMQEIASFMQSRGYRGHSGVVDQTVINELADYMGNRIVPVYVGGFYAHMDSIMVGGHTGSMQPIISNLRDMVPHVTVGARWVQCCLKKLGYYTGPIDGKYGEGTEKAVKAFQRAYRFEERDYVTLGVARAMLEQCYYSGCSLSDLP